MTKSAYENHSHLLETDEANKCIHAYRIFENGEKNYLTRFDLPKLTIGEDKKGFHEFARILAMYLFCDSPMVRELMDFESVDSVVDKDYEE